MGDVGDMRLVAEGSSRIFQRKKDMVRLVATLLFVRFLAPASAEACAFPDDYVPTVSVYLSAGSQSTRLGESVSFVTAYHGCNAYSSVSDVSALRVTVGTSPLGPFTREPVEVRHNRATWTPSQTGTLFVRFESEGHHAKQMVFLVHAADASVRRVQLERPLARSRALAVFYPSELSATERAAWDLPIVRVRRRPGAAAEGMFTAGTYSIHSGRLRIDRLFGHDHTPRVRRYVLGPALMRVGIGP